MTQNVYSAPSAKLIEEPHRDEEPHFYVVSGGKFWIFFLVSLSTYMLYWAYRHWSHYRAKTGEDLWPVPRAFFLIFFTHSLFQKIDNKIKSAHLEYRWPPALMATLFVCLLLARNLLSRVADYQIGLPYTLLLSLIAIPLMGWPLFAAQKAANVACNDPQGHSNKRMTLANILWILVFGLFWALIFAGLWVTSSETPFV